MNHKFLFISIEKLLAKVKVKATSNNLWIRVQNLTDQVKFTLNTIKGAEKLKSPTIKPRFIYIAEKSPNQIA